MGKKSIFLIVIILLALLPIISANGYVETENHEAQGSAYFDGYTINVLHPDTIKPNTDFYVYGSYYDNKGKLLDNGTAECLLGILSPLLDRVVIYEEQNMTFLNGDTIQVTKIDGTFLNETGEYTFNYNCDVGAGTTGGFFHGSVTVTRTGDTIDTPQSIIYIGILTIITLLFFLSLYFTIALPYRNNKEYDEAGSVINIIIPKAKYVKLGLILITHALMIWVLNLLIGLSDSFLNLPIFYGIVSFLFTTLIIITLPLFFFIMIIAGINITRDLKAEQLLNKLLQRKNG